MAEVAKREPGQNAGLLKDLHTPTLRQQPYKCHTTHRDTGACELKTIVRKKPSKVISIKTVSIIPDFDASPMPLLPDH